MYCEIDVISISQYIFSYLEIAFNRIEVMWLISGDTKDTVIHCYIIVIAKLK